MIRIVVQCIEIKLIIISAMHWDCIAHDRHNCAMQWDCIAYAKHNCAMQWN